VVQEGWRLAHPLRPAGAATGALVTTDEPDVVVDAVKLAFDGSGDVVVRLHNAAEGRRTARVGFGFPVAETRRTDVRERPLPEGPLGDPVLVLPPFRFVTLRVRRA
jgi:alpha-mannosidase